MRHLLCLVLALFFASPALAQNGAAVKAPIQQVPSASIQKVPSAPIQQVPSAPALPTDANGVDVSQNRPAPDAAAVAAGIPMPDNLPPEITGETPPDANLLPPLKTIIERGGKAHYMGQRYGMHGWFITQNGQIQVMYLTPDQQGIVFGAMFGLYSGENITGGQVKNLSDTNSEVRAVLSQSRDLQAEGTRQLLEATPAAKPQTPGEKLLYDLVGAVGFSVGSSDAPLMMMVIDPFCPFCKATWKKLAPIVSMGRLQVRIVPVANEGSDNERAAAVLLGKENPAADWDSFVQGNKAVLEGEPTRPELLQSVRDNKALADRWRIPATPYLVYRGRSGQIMVVQGAPDSIEAVLADLAGPNE